LSDYIERQLRDQIFELKMTIRELEAERDSAETLKVMFQRVVAERDQLREKVKELGDQVTRISAIRESMKKDAQ
jgi:uncharacterized coiled-coil DUF342 family protein